MMVDPWGLDGELNNPLIQHAIASHTGPPPTSYALPRNFQLGGLPYNQGESEKKGMFVLGSSGRAPTTQYTTDELHDMPYRTVIRLGLGYLGLTSRFEDLEGGDVLALAVFDEANSR